MLRDLLTQKCSHKKRLFGTQASNISGLSTEKPVYPKADPGHILFLRIYILSYITAKKVI
jgi:hypothetical protein